MSAAVRAVVGLSWGACVRPVYMSRLTSGVKNKSIHELCQSDDSRYLSWRGSCLTKTSAMRRLETVLLGMKHAET